MFEEAPNKFFNEETQGRMPQSGAGAQRGFERLARPGGKNEVALQFNGEMRQGEPETQNLGHFVESAMLNIDIFCFLGVKN